MPTGTRQDWVNLTAQLRGRGEPTAGIADALRRRFGLAALAAPRVALGWSQRDAARQWSARWPENPKSYKDFSTWETGRHTPSLDTFDKLAELYSCELTDLLADRSSRSGTPARSQDAPSDADAWELAGRVEASDVGPTTVEALERIVDELCRSYTNTTPTELLNDLGTYRRYITSLLGGRASLTQRRTLAVLGGWLSLLAACAQADLGHDSAAVANREVARSLGKHAGHPEIGAWATEVAAWQAILAGRYQDAVQLCRTGREPVATGTSAHTQLLAQEARALARLGRADEAHALLDQLHMAVDRMDTPERPDHHFVFDPRKHVGYTATTLAWLRDVEHGEAWARQAVDQYEDDARQGRSTRRLATARIDLALILVAAGAPDEAAHLGTLALNSGRLVPSNIWRATELDQVLHCFPSIPEVSGFHDLYIDTHQAITD